MRNLMVCLTIILTVAIAAPAMADSAASAQQGQNQTMVFAPTTNAEEEAPPLHTTVPNVPTPPAHFGNFDFKDPNEMGMSIVMRIATAWTPGMLESFEINEFSKDGVDVVVAATDSYKTNGHVQLLPAGAKVQGTTCGIMVLTADNEKTTPLHLVRQGMTIAHANGVNVVVLAQGCFETTIHSVAGFGLSGAASGKASGIFAGGGMGPSFGKTRAMNRKVPWMVLGMVAPVNAKKASDDIRIPTPRVENTTVIDKALDISGR